MLIFVSCACSGTSKEAFEVIVDVARAYLLKLGKILHLQEDNAMRPPAMVFFTRTPLQRQVIARLNLY